MQNQIPKPILLITRSLATTSGPAHGAGDPRFSKRAPNTQLGVHTASKALWQSK